MAEKTYLQAISDGLRQEMRRDKRVFMIGEDVGVYGGAFKVTQGFQEEFGPWRVIDAPLAETAIVGGCTGAAIMGMRPVAEMQFADFVSCAWDHLVTVAAKQRYRAGTPVPIVVRCPSGGGFSRRALPLAEPGVELRAHPGPEGRLPGDARGRQGADRDARSRTRTRSSTSSTSTSTGASRPTCPDERYTIPFGEARVHREGDDITLVTWGAMVYTASEAADKVAEEDGISTEIIDLRTIIPWDRKAVLASVEKTSKVIVLHEDTHTGGFGGEIAATIAEEAFENLDAPVRRITAPDTPVPFAPALEKAFLPQVDDVVAGHPGAGRVLMATGTARRRRHAPDGRLRLGGDDHEVAQGRGRGRRGRRDAPRDLDRQGRHRGAEPGLRGRAADPRPGGRDGRGRDEDRGDRARGRRRCRPPAAEEAPAQLPPRSRPSRATQAAAAESAAASRRRGERRPPRRACGSAEPRPRRRQRRTASRERRALRLARSSRASPPSTASTSRRSPAPAAAGA